jgi:hypothetical protein
MESSAARVALQPTRSRTVILEIADIRIAPGQQAAFDEAIQRSGESD